MVQIGEHWIALDHKDAYVQFLQQGGELDARREGVETPPAPELSALFSSTWKIYCGHFRLIAALYLTVWVPCGLLESYVEAQHWFPESLSATIRLNSWLEALVGVIATGAILHVARSAWDGRVASYSEALRVGLRKWGALLRVQLLINFAAGIGLLLLIIPGMLVMIRSTFAHAIIIEHDESATGAFDASWQIAKGHFWRILGFGLVVGVVSYMPTVVLGFVTGIADEALRASTSSDVVEGQLWILDWLASAIGGVTIPIAVIFFYVFYKVLRAEADRAIQRQRPAAPPPGVRPPRPVGHPPQPPKSPLPPAAGSGNLPA